MWSQYRYISRNKLIDATTKLLFALLAILMLGTSKATASEVVSMTLNYDGTNHSYNNYSVALYVNNSELTDLDVPAVIISDRVYVPVRYVFESMGGEVSYNEENQQVFIGYDDNLILLTIDSYTMNVNGNEVALEVAPKIVNDRTMVPVRFAAEALNFTVDWDDETRSAYISSVNLDSSYVNTVETSEILAEADTEAIINAGTSVSATLGLEEMPVSTSDNKPLVTENSASSSTLAATDVSAMTIPYEANAKTTVTGITLPGADGAGVYSIKASSAITGVEKMLLSDNRLVIDIYNAELSLSQTTYEINSVILTSIRAGQNEIDSNRVARIVFDLAAAADYSVSISDDRTTVYVSFVNETVQDLQFENFSYNTSTRVLTLAKTAETNFSVDAFVHNDNYSNSKYILTLPGDFSASYGSGDYTINDSYLSGINIITVGGATMLTLNENRIIAVTITEDSDNYYINVKTPREVYSKIVYLDPGHGDSDPGTSGLYTQEKEIDLDIALRVAALIEADGSIKCYMSRTSDTYPTLSERPAEANQSADLFVSIHTNAANNVANGTETYYREHSNDSAIGYTSKQAADIFHANLVESLQFYDRGVKTANFVVLREANIPAVLLELGFIDAEPDASLLQTDEYRDKAAQAIYKSIVEVFAEYDPLR